MASPVVQFETDKFMSSMQTTLRQLGAYGKAGAAALDIAMVEYAQKMLDEMKANITHKSGGSVTNELAKSGSVVGPFTKGDYTIVQIVWTAPYARIQDKGGFIYPKNVSAATRYNKNVFSTKHNVAVRGHLGRFISRRTLNTARLFVPLRPGVVPIKDPIARKAMGYKWDVDYVLARSVEIKGSQYISKVLRKRLPNAARDIGSRAEQIWNQMAASGAIA